MPAPVPGEAAGAGPPEIAVTVACPERESATKLTRATPFTVLPEASIRPRSVKKKTSVPSGTNVPAGSTRIAVTTDTPPFAITNGGFAMSVMLVPGAAVNGTDSQATIPIAAQAPRRARPAASRP